MDDMHVRRVNVTIDGLPEGGYLFVSRDGQPIKACTHLSEVQEQIYSMLKEAFGKDERGLAERFRPDVVAENAKGVISRLRGR